MGENRVQRVAAPLRQQVIEQLREAILSQEFEPGTRLIEKVLCDRYEVSRTVVREALRHLEAEGLVSLVANQGPVIPVLTYSDAVALYEVRGALEALAGKLFAERASTEECAALRRALEGVRDTLSDPALTSVLDAKDAFYGALIDGAHNEIIRTNLRTIHARVQMLRGLSLRSRGRSPRTIAELEEITRAAAVDRDPDAAWTACDQHVRAAAEVALGILAEQDTTGPAHQHTSRHG